MIHYKTQSYAFFLLSMWSMLEKKKQKKLDYSNCCCSASDYRMIVATSHCFLYHQDTALGQFLLSIAIRVQCWVPSIGQRRRRGSNIEGANSLPTILLCSVMN